MEIAKSNVKIKVGSILTGTIRNGYKVYFNVFIKGKRVETRGMPSAKKVYDSNERQYVYYYKGVRYWNLRLLKDMIKNDVCSGVIETLNG